jgi:hypothetical protein
MRELRERAGPALRILCLILAALVVFQLAGIFLRWSPFRGVTVPQLPTLTADTNSPAGDRPGKNLVASTILHATNSQPHLTGINPVPPAPVTNSNSPAHAELVKAGTGPESNAVAYLPAKLGGTNSTVLVVPMKPGTNLLISKVAMGTNAASGLKPERHAAPAAQFPGTAAMNFNPFQSPAGPPIKLSPAVHTQITRIIDSEIFGPVMHPQPMALLGIAGDCAFLRSASGQTGLVKEGDSLDDIKLLRIGINRVLVEQDGQQKELTIFSGYGSESLLSKETTHENTPQ